MSRWGKFASGAKKFGQFGARQAKRGAKWAAPRAKKAAQRGYAYGKKQAPVVKKHAKAAAKKGYDYSKKQASDWYRGKPKPKPKRSPSRKRTPQKRAPPKRKVATKKRTVPKRVGTKPSNRRSRPAVRSRSWRCLICGKNFKTQQTYTRHLQGHTLQTHKKALALNRAHYRAYDHVAGTTKVRCKLCGKTLPTHAAYERHLFQHVARRGGDYVVRR